MCIFPTMISSGCRTDAHRSTTFHDHRASGYEYALSVIFQGRSRDPFGDGTEEKDEGDTFYDDTEEDEKGYIGRHIGSQGDKENI